MPQYANFLFGISPYIVNITFLATETVKQHKLNQKNKTGVAWEKGRPKWVERKEDQITH